MKKYIYSMALLLSVTMFGHTAQAVNGDALIDLADQEIQVTILAFEVQRKNSIAQALHLTSEEMGFWSVYNDYRAEMKKVIDDKVKIIADYAYAYRFDNLTDKDASKLLDRYIANLTKQVKVKRGFVRKFKKVLSAKKVARFYQLDNRIDLILNLQIAGGVPLVE